MEMSESVKERLRPLVGLQRSVVQLATESSRDFGSLLRDARYSRPARSGVAALQREAAIDAHRIEKGFTLPHVLRPFPVDPSRPLKRTMAQRKFAEVDPVFQRQAEASVAAMATWNDGGSIDGRVAPAGPAIEPFADPEAFFAARRTCRNYEMGGGFPQR